MPRNSISKIIYVYISDNSSYPFIQSIYIKSASYFIFSTINKIIHVSRNILNSYHQMEFSVITVNAGA